MIHSGNEMQSEIKSELINWPVFGEARDALGEHFIRLLGYFKEDGMKSVAAMEEAMRQKSSVGLVLPAHTLKGEAAQFGADKLALAAEEIEVAARHYVEIHQTDPSDMLAPVAQLRPLFEESIKILETEASPLIQRKPVGFGNRNIAGFGNRT